MGAWGTGIFADDEAADLRDDYRELLGDGKSSEEATDILITQWKPEPEETVFWLALAATQWRCGRLEERVKAKAVQIIDSEADLDRWKEVGNGPNIRKRSGVLQRLRTRLTSPQPQKTKIKKRYRSTTDWERGELVAYKLASGKTIIFRVIGVQGDKGGTWPVCEILDWTGDSIPEISEMSGMPIRRCIDDKTSRPQLGIGRASRKEYPEQRLTRLQRKLPPSQDVGYPNTFTLWRILDSTLAKCFGLQ